MQHVLDILYYILLLICFVCHQKKVKIFLILDVEFESKSRVKCLHLCPLILHRRAAICFQSSSPMFMFVDFIPKAHCRSVVSLINVWLGVNEEVKQRHSAKSKETDSNQQTLSKPNLEQASLFSTRHLSLPDFLKKSAFLLSCVAEANSWLKTFSFTDSFLDTLQPFLKVIFPLLSVNFLN